MGQGVSRISFPFSFLHSVFSLILFYLFGGGFRGDEKRTLTFLGTG